MLKYITPDSLDMLSDMLPDKFTDYLEAYCDDPDPWQLTHLFNFLRDSAWQVGKLLTDDDRQRTAWFLEYDDKLGSVTHVVSDWPEARLVFLESDDFDTRCLFLLPGNQVLLPEHNNTECIRLWEARFAVPVLF